MKRAMDPALLKAKESFKRRALANPVVERLSKKPDSESAISKAKVAKKSKDEIPRPQKGKLCFVVYSVTGRRPMCTY